MTQSNNKFPYFKENQILRHTDLNQLVTYIQAQNNLMRVLMVGSGILNGLEVTENLAGNHLTITGGYGISSDGYFFQMGTTELTHVKKSAINKAAFQCNNPEGVDRCGSDGETLTIYELEDAENPPADYAPIDFEEDAFREFYEKSVLLLLWCTKTEDRKLCINECDEQGADATVSIRKILVSKTALEEIETKNLEDQTVDPIGEIPDDEIVLGAPPFVRRLGSNEAAINLSDIRDYASLKTLYLNNFDEITNSIATAYAYTGITHGHITALLEECKSIFDNNDNCNIQYFYDYLRDLVLAYLEYEEVVCQKTVSQPGSKPVFCAHPGYLKLGQPGTFSECRNSPPRFSSFQTADPADLDIIGFYWNRMSFLTRKENLKLEFPGNYSNEKGIIKITPSQGKNVPLSRRAIPFYYENVETTLREKWRYDWRKESLFPRIPSYFASGTATPPFAQHFQYEIDTYDFFRIEGHLGQEVAAVVKKIKELRAENNLAFDIECVKLGEKSPNLEELAKIEKEVDCADLEALYLEAKFDLLCALDAIDVNFDANAAQYIAVVSLKNYLRNSDLPNGVDFKNFFKYFASFDFAYDKAKPYLFPNQEIDCFFEVFDNLRATFRARFDQFTFQNFIANHPGIEHQAGVPKGGTLILAYEATENGCIVKADFALPYYCCGSNAGGSPPPKPQPFIILNPYKFCHNDEQEYLITTYPAGGVLSGSVEGDYLNGNIFSPSGVTFSEDVYEVPVTFQYNCDGVIAEVTVVVCRVIARFIYCKIEEEGEDIIRYKLIDTSEPTENINPSWEVSNGLTVNEEDEIIYPLDSNFNKFKVTLEVSNKVCTDSFDRKITMNDLSAECEFTTEDLLDEAGNINGVQFNFVKTGNGINPVWKAELNETEEGAGENFILEVLFENEIDSFTIELKIEDEEGNCAIKRKSIPVPEPKIEEDNEELIDLLNIRRNDLEGKLKELAGDSSLVKLDSFKGVHQFLQLLNTHPNLHNLLIETVETIATNYAKSNTSAERKEQYETLIGIVVANYLNKLLALNPNNFPEIVVIETLNRVVDILKDKNVPPNKMIQCWAGSDLKSVVDKGVLKQIDEILAKYMIN